LSVIKTISGSYPWQAADAIEWPVTTETGPGLRGVIACDTRVSWLDPSSGLLMYRGEPVERLAGSVSFEDVAFLLITGVSATDDPQRAAAFAQRLRSSRELPQDVVALVRSIDPGVHPTRILRAGVSALGCHELSATDELSGSKHWRELRIVGQVTALVALIARHRRGLDPIVVPADCSLAAGMLLALTGREPEPEDVRVLETLWVLYADHGLDAPTFTSMIVASCHADPYYNIVAGLSALRGPQLGGATESVLEQLLPLTTPATAREWTQQAIAAGTKIAGFGHRMYRMADPRAVVLRRELAMSARRHEQPQLFDVARAVEEEAARTLAASGVHVNINFYAAPLFHLLGAEAPLVPCLYAVGRMAGLVARVYEALESDRLYRPLSNYVGPKARPLPGPESTS
jgi:citrate synthase